MPTPKEIRNKMYLWILKKGVVLDKKDYEEIKKILQEFKNCVNPCTIEIKSEPPQKSIRKEMISDWKSYPSEE